MLDTAMAKIIQTNENSYFTYKIVC